MIILSLKKYFLMKKKNSLLDYNSLKKLLYVSNYNFLHVKTKHKNMTSYLLCK